MADQIQSPMGQQMADAAQGVAPPQAPTAPPPPSPQQIDQQAQNQPAPQDSAQDGHPVGTVGDQQRQQQQDNPSGGSAVTATEQAQYVQLVTRFIMMTHSMVSQGDGKPSALKATVDVLNNPKVPISKAVGITTANAIFAIHNMAKSHGVSYDPDVLFHGADECVVAIYLMGQAAGVFKGTPPYQGFDGEKTYPFTPGEQNLLARAKMVAVAHFGKALENAKMITDGERQQATDFWQKQISHELKSGFVDPKVIDDLKKSGLASRQAEASQSQSQGDQSQPAPAQSQPPPDQSQPPPAPTGIAPPAPGGQ